MSDLTIYREFPDAESAETFASMLAENKIDCVVEAPERVDSFSKLYAARAPDLTYKVKIKVADTGRVNTLVEQLAADELASLPKGHFLLSFSTEELQQMMAYPEEWSLEDYTMARHILEQKGITYTDAELAGIRQKRIAEITKPKTASAIFLVVGYLSALAGGLIGFVIGWHLWLSHKESPDGKPYFTYDKPSRTHGMAMFLIAIVVVIVTASYLIMEVNRYEP